MMKIVSDLVKGNMNIDDKMLSESMMTTAKEGAMLYLTSAKTSTTPELRTLYTAAVGQMLEGDAALTALAIKKGWLKPYESPVNQLGCAYNCAKDTVSKQE
ncbi:MAG: spore coat protein [bacterium]|nr:spore coat protein [bacterium]